jgi:Mg-chelatase subunit ChlD
MEATLFALSNSEKCGEYTHFLQLKTTNVAERTPIHIIAVIDISGSMQFYNKLENVKKSLKAILEFMTTTDMISIITFSKNSDVIARRMQTTPENKYIITQKISQIDVDCSTNLSSGLISGFECQIRSDVADGNHKTSILLLTDGEANEGITEPDTLINLIRSECSVNTTVYTFGYGMDHNASLLSLIADECNGGYNIVNSLENVATAIGCAFGTIASCVAQNISVEGAEFYSGFPTTIYGGARLGDMTAGGEIGVLVKNLREIEIKGYSVQNGFAPFKIKDEEIQIKDATAETDKAAYITYMRVKLAGYIDNIPSDSVLNEFEAALEGDDDIIKIMRKEVRELKRKKTLGINGEEDASVLTQHAQFYRTLRTQYSVIPPLLGRPLGDSNHEATESINFSSPVVRRITQNIFSHATRSENDNEVSVDVPTDPSDNILSVHADESAV